MIFNSFFNHKCVKFGIFAGISARASVVSKFTDNSIESIWLENICYDQHDNTSTKRDESSNGSSEWNIFRKYLLKISQPCSQMLLMCRYALDTFKCMELFDTVLSDEGLNGYFFQLFFNFLLSIVRK